MKCPKCKADGFQDCLILDHRQVLAMCLACGYIDDNPNLPAHLFMRIEYGIFKGVRFVYGKSPIEEATDEIRLAGKE